MSIKKEIKVALKQSLLEMLMEAELDLKTLGGIDLDKIERG